MTASDRLREIFQKLSPASQLRLYDDVRTEIPRHIRRVVALFRWMCATGGRIPVPVVVVEQESTEGHQAYVRDIIAEGSGIYVQMFVIRPHGTSESLCQERERCGYTETEVAIRLAAHEARHCLQRRRRVDTWRGPQWLQRYFRSLPQHVPFRYWGSIIYEPACLVEHADYGLPVDASRRERQRGRMRELDAAVTGVACVRCWRLTHRLAEVARLLHG